MNVNQAQRAPVSRLSRYTTDAVYYGDQNLVQDLLGHASFVDVFFHQTFGRMLTEAERKIVNAVLITLMEHGLTPSAIAARMVYSSSPENLQAGVAAGLLAVASQFVGTMEPAAQLLDEIVQAGEKGEAKAKQIAQAHRQQRIPVPGFGHHMHKPDDPRAIALLKLAEQVGTYGDRCRALQQLASAVDQASGQHITVNATGAIAALLGDIGIPPRLMRGFAVLSRAAGLISHISEEQREPSGRYIWSLVDQALSAPQQV